MFHCEDLFPSLKGTLPNQAKMLPQ